MTKEILRPKLTPLIMPHTPHAHIEHNRNVICGCWTLDSRPLKYHKFLCSCGALYEREEVLSLARWRCYDCAAVYISAQLPRRGRPKMPPLEARVAMGR